MKKIYVWMLLCWCVSGMSAAHAADCSEKSPYTIEQWAEKIDYYSGQSNVLEQASAALLCMHKADPENGDILVQIANIHLSMGYISGDNYEEEAIVNTQRILDKVFTKIITMPDRAFGLQAALHRINDEPEKIAEVIKRARAFGLTKVQDKTIQFHEGVYAQLAEKNLAKAEGIYRRLAHDTAYPRRSAAISYLLDILWDQEGEAQIQEMNELYQILLKERPTAWRYGNYSRFLRKKVKDYERAIEYAKKALAIMDYGNGRRYLYTALVAHAKKVRDASLKGHKESLGILKQAFGVKRPEYSYVAATLGHTYNMMAKKVSKSWEDNLNYKCKAVKWMNYALTQKPDYDYAKNYLAKHFKEVNKFKPKDMPVPCTLSDVAGDAEFNAL